MKVLLCTLYIELLYTNSLKGRRAVLNSIKAKLKTFNISVLDISGEYAKEAELVFVYVSPDNSHAKSYRDRIENMIEKNFCQYEYELICEEI